MKQRKYSETDIARIAADTIVLILFFILLTVISAFACVFYFLLWLLGVV